MTLFHRRILTLILFILLITLGPGLILYGAGYRINFSQQRIERVGLLHITTDPENTTITLDGQSYPVPDELVLSSLKPREYDIVISKEDYHSWYKRLEIRPGASTFIRELQLFLDQPTSTVETIPSSAFFLVSTDEMAFFQSQDQLVIFDYSGETKTSLSLENDFPVINTSAPSQDTLVFQQNGEWYYYNGITVEGIQPESIEEPIIALERSGNSFYFFTESALWKSSVTDTTVAEVVTNQLLGQDLLVEGTTIWYLATEPAKKHSFLYRMNNEQSRPELLATLSYEENYTIADNQDGFLTIYGKDQEKLIFVDANTLPPQTKEITQVKDWAWAQANQQLLVATEFELFILHFEDNQRQELLMRLSKPFSNAAWEINEQHAFFISEDKLHIIERDERFQRNSIVLTEMQPGLRLLHLPPSGQEAYLMVPSDTGELEIQKLPLRE